MDLHFLDARPSDEERAAVDAVLGPPSSGWTGGERSAPDAHVAFGGREAAQALRPQLLPVLHAVNDRVGWVSQGALNYVAQRLEVPPAEAYGVLTFYALLSPVARPPRVVHVCTDLACRMRDVHGLTAGAGAEGEPQNGGRVVWHSSPCLGVCERAPAAMVTEAGVEPRVEVVAPASPDAVHALLEGRAAPPEPAPEVSVPQQGEDALVLLRRIGTGRSVVAGGLPRPRRLRGAPPRARPRTGRGDPGGHRGQAPGPGRRRLPDRPQVGRGRRPARPPAPPGVQRRRVRAGHVQGPRAHGGRPVRGRRGDDDRRAHHRRASTATCTCGASTRAPAGASSTPSRRPAGSASSART